MGGWELCLCGQEVAYCTVMMVSAITVITWSSYLHLPLSLFEREEERGVGRKEGGKEEMNAREGGAGEWKTEKKKDGKFIIRRNRGNYLTSPPLTSPLLTFPPLTS